MTVSELIQDLLTKIPPHERDTSQVYIESGYEPAGKNAASEVVRAGYDVTVILCQP